MIASISQLRQDFIFKEDDASGMFYDNRKEYQKMVNLAQSGGLDVIIVMKMDRLHRDYTNCETQIRLLNSFGCLVLAGDMAMPNSPTDEFVQGILMLQNRYHARLVASDTIKVEINNVKKGKSAGGIAPYGYEVIAKRYFINENEAPAIRRIFEMISNGYSYKETINKITSLGFKTRNGERFSPSSLNAILRNGKYYGEYLYNRKNGKRRKNRVLIEKFDEVRNMDAIPAIISEELFNKVQDILNGRKGTCCSAQKSTTPFILTGLLYCKSCNKPMSGKSQTAGKSKTKMRYYTCPNHSKNGKTCKTKDVNANSLETAVKELITKTINAYLRENKQGKGVFVDLEGQLKRNIADLTKNKQSLETKIKSTIARVAKSSSETLQKQYELSIETDSKSVETLNAEIAKTNDKLSALEKLKTSSKQMRNPYLTETYSRTILKLEQ